MQHLQNESTKATQSNRQQAFSQLRNTITRLFSSVKTEVDGILKLHKMFASGIQT